MAGLLEAFNAQVGKGRRQQIQVGRRDEGVLHAMHPEGRQVEDTIAVCLPVFVVYGYIVAVQIEGCRSSDRLSEPSGVLGNVRIAERTTISP